MKWGRNLGLSIKALSRARLRTLLEETSSWLQEIAVNASDNPKASVSPTAKIRLERITHPQE